MCAVDSTSIGSSIRLALVVIVLAAGSIACGSPAPLTELQRVRSGTIDVVLLSARDAIRHGADTFVVEFRSSAGGSLVDVGEVRGSATMPMPGMPMFGSIAVKRTETAGRYSVESSFEMAGTWRLTLEWQGRSVTFAATIQ